MKIFLWILALVPLITSSNTVKFAQSTDQSPDSHDLQGSHESRHRSLTVTSAQPNPAISSSNMNIATSISMDHSDIANQLTHPRVMFFNRNHHAVSYAQLPRDQPIISPRSSPIIHQLNSINLLLATQFSPSTTSKPLMTGHMAILKGHCRHLATKFGPLRQKARLCALRYHELQRFLQILQSYQSLVGEYKVGLEHEQFCTKLFANVKNLKKLVNAALMDYSSIPASVESETMTRALQPLHKEIIVLEGAIDSLDLDILVYCHKDPNNHSSIDATREILSRFLHLAFSS